MNEQPTPQNHENYISKAVEVVIRISVLALIIGWCVMIMAPFLSIIIWSVVIAVAIYPIFDSLSRKFGNRQKLAAVLIGLAFLVIILVPSFFLGDSLVEGIQNLKVIYQSGDFQIPPPGETVKSWPAIAKPVVDLWQLASVNLSDAATQYTSQIKMVGEWLLKAITGVGLGILQFIGAIIIATIFLVFSKEGGAMMQNVFIRLAGTEGESFAKLSEVTIRNVAKGVLGVAFIQTFLAGVGIVVAGVPLAGLWILFCLILAMVQIGVGPIMIPIAIYVFVTADTLTAVLFLGWTILVVVSDNILKPILLGKGAPVPMLVVFLGSVGGFIANGFIGLFIGPVILSLGYKLFLGWVNVEARKADDAL